MELPFAEPYKIKMVEPIYQSTRAEREKWIREAKYNLFNLRSEQVYIDLLTDSGTGAMSDRQWAAIMAGRRKLCRILLLLFPEGYHYEFIWIRLLFPYSPGAGCRKCTFFSPGKRGRPGTRKSHFDTTKGHIEFRNATAVDCTIGESFDTENVHPFKGNVDI